MDFQQQQQQQQQQQLAAQNQLKQKQGHFFQKGKPFVKKGRQLSDIAGTYLVVYDHYQLIKRVGDGAYGVVFKAINKSKNNELVAIKKVSDAFLDPRDAKRILREIKLLKFCDHPNIIKLKDIIKPEMPTGYKDIYLVLEFMEIDLDKTINSEQALSPRLIKNLMWQLLNGIYYMHSADIIHRDIKPSNILLNKNCTLKLADMNLARKFDVEQSSITEYVVTRPYRAPEILLSTENYSKPIDIWSAGCIFAEMMGRKTIFKGNSYVNQLDRIVAIMGKPDFDKLSYKVDEGLKDYIKSFQEKQPENFYEIYKSHDPLAIDLLYKMLAFDPKERWTVEQCLHHQYFHDFDKSVIKACNQKFDWSFDEIQERNDLIQRAIYNESCEFHQDEPDATQEEVEQHYKQQQQILQQKMVQHQAANAQNQQQFMKTNPQFQMNLEKLAAQQLINPMAFNPNVQVPFFPPGRNPQVPPAAILLYQQQMQNLQKANPMLQKQFQMMPGQQLQMPLQKDFGNPFSTHPIANPSNFNLEKNQKLENFPVNSIQNPSAVAASQNPMFVPGLHNFPPGFHPIKMGQQDHFKKPNLNMNQNSNLPKQQNTNNDSSSPKSNSSSENKKADTTKNILKQNGKEGDSQHKKDQIPTSVSNNQSQEEPKENKMNKQNIKEKVVHQDQENHKSNGEGENPEQKCKKREQNEENNKGEESKSADLLKENTPISDDPDQLPSIPEMRYKTLTFGPEHFNNNEKTVE